MVLHSFLRERPCSQYRMHKQHLCTSQAIIFSCSIKEAPTSSPSACRDDILPPKTKQYISKDPPLTAPTDSPTAIALDEFSRLWPPPSAPRVNDGRPTSLADTFDENNYTERRDEASDVSYPYRPALIDFDPQQQRQQNFLPTSLPFNNTFPLESHRNTDVQQGLASIGENELPHGYPSMKFVMNPEAPVFVPGLAGEPGMPSLSCRVVSRRQVLTELIAMKAGDPRDGVYHGLPQQKPSQVPGKSPVFYCSCHCVLVIHYLSMLPFTGFFPVVTCLHVIPSSFSTYRNVRSTGFFPIITCSNPPTKPNHANRLLQQPPPTLRTSPTHSPKSRSSAAATA